MQNNIKQSFCVKVDFKKLFSYYRYANFKNNVGLLNGRFSYYSSLGLGLCNISRENFVPFESMIELRRNEAKKSIVVEIQKEENLTSLQSFCSEFGTIKNMFEFKPYAKEHMCIVEFEEESSLKDIICEAQQNTSQDFGSIYLPFLKMVNKKLYSQSIESQQHQPVPVKLLKEQSRNEIIKHLRHNCSNISEQIQYYYDTQRMTELGWRLRFLTCRKIEWVLPRILSHIKILPFGSSVNTFGNHDSDLDMIVDFTKKNKEKKVKDFPLTIQPGKESNSSRGCMQRNLEMIADLMSFYMPGFSQILKILHAKVPIIKCNELFTGLECDITFSNKSGYYMSELLYIYGCSDPRVRPLVFCVRWWAKEKGLTQKMQPGRWFSNFTTTLLVLFFLMNTKQPVIPPLNLLETISDTSFTSEGITYKFEKDVSRLPLTSNTDSLEVLLIEFFSFYANFDCKKVAISIVTGNTYQKPNFSALYVQNPIERELNVSGNVNLEEVELFKTECLLASSVFRRIKESDAVSKDALREKGLDLVSVVVREGDQDSLRETSWEKSNRKSRNKGDTLLDINNLFDDTAVAVQNREFKSSSPKTDGSWNTMRKRNAPKISGSQKKGKSKRGIPPFMFS